MKTFLSKHIKWVASVGHDVLSKKRLALEDYANDLSEGEIPLDPLGLLCIARNWHIHICVFLKNGIWTTRRDNTLENISIYLLYTGGFTFFDTCVQLPLRPSILPQSNEENSTSDLEDVLTKSIMDTVGTKDTSFATNTADEENSTLDLEDVLTKSIMDTVGTKDTSFAKPNTLKEEDPILQAFKDNQPEELAELLKDDSDEKNTNKSSLVSSDEVTMEGDKVQVKEYALKRRKKKQKTFHCSSDGCETMECTRKAMNVHEKENHLDISYTCSATNFSSYESVFKHEQCHYKFIHPCDVCGNFSSSHLKSINTKLCMIPRRVSFVPGEAAKKH